jgi:hypothetical protein
MNRLVRAKADLRLLAPRAHAVARPITLNFLFAAYPAAAAPYPWQKAGRGFNMTARSRQRAVGGWHN